MWAGDGLRVYMRDSLTMAETSDPDHSIWYLLADDTDHAVSALFNLLVDNWLVDIGPVDGKKRGMRCYIGAHGPGKSYEKALALDVCERTVDVYMDAVSVLPSLAESACRRRTGLEKWALHKICERCERIMQHDRKAWSETLRDKLVAYFASHLTPEGVRWGHVYGKNNMSACPWTATESRSDAFAQHVADLMQARSKGTSVQAAQKSFERNSAIAVVDFSSDFDVSGMLREADLKEAWLSAGCLADFIVYVCALRASLAKCLHWRRDAKTYEVFYHGMWLPLKSDAFGHLGDAVDPDTHLRVLADTLVDTTVRDLDRLRVRPCYSRWLAGLFERPFLAVTQGVVRQVSETVHKILQANQFLTSYGKLDKETLETSDPAIELQRSDWVRSWCPPQRQALKRSMPDRVQVKRACATVDSSPLPCSVLWTESPRSCPDLEVLDVHLRDADALHPAPYAAVYILDRGGGSGGGAARWRFPAYQNRGSVFMWSVSECLGYRGMGKTTFCATVFDSVGNLHDAVAVTSGDRSRVQGRHVVSDMAKLEGEAAARIRTPLPLRCCAHPFLACAPFPASQANITRMVDQGYSMLAQYPDAPSFSVTDHTQGSDGVVKYTTTRPSPRARLDIQVQGWGDSDDYSRSAVRSYWSTQGILCPHDMGMRLTKTSTHVIFDRDGAELVSRQYLMSQSTMIAAWDGFISVADQRDDAVVYLLKCDIPDVKHSIAVVAGMQLSPGLPASTVRFIEAYWLKKKQHSPHVQADQDAGDPVCDLVATIDMSCRDEIARWLEAECGRVTQ